MALASSIAQGSTSVLCDCCPAQLQEALSCQENAAEECQIEGILQCSVKIVANGLGQHPDKKTPRRNVKLKLSLNAQQTWSRGCKWVLKAPNLKGFFYCSAFSWFVILNLIY